MGAILEPIRAFAFDPNVLIVTVVLGSVLFVLGIGLTINAARQRVKLDGLVQEGEFPDRGLFLDRYPIGFAHRLAAPILVGVEERVGSDLYDTFKLAGRPGWLGRKSSGSDIFAAFSSIAICSIFVFALLMAYMGASLMGILLIAVIGGAGVFGLLWSSLNGDARDRQIEIDNEFPYYLDMAVMSVQAGATVEDTFDLYVEGREPSPLIDELRLVSAELKKNVTFIDAMMSLRARTDALSIEMTVSELVNSMEAGTPTSDIMRVVSKELRDLRTANAEQMGEKLKLKIMLPGFLMAGSAMIIILGPAIIELTNSGMF